MSLVFNGAQQTTSTTATHTLGNGSFTVMAWIKVFTSGATGTMSILSEENTAGNARQGIDIRYVNGNIVVEKTFSYQVLIIITNYRSITATSTSTISAEQYHHIAVTWNGTTLTLYVNGILHASTNYTNGDTSLTVISNTLGARRTANATWDQFFQGEILDFRKYGVALPEGEISTIATCSGLDFITQDLSYRYLTFGVPATNATQIDDWSANNYDRAITTTVPFG